MSDNHHDEPEDGFPDLIPPTVPTRPHPHNRVGNPAPEPKRYTQEELAAMSRFAQANQVEGQFVPPPFGSPPPGPVREQAAPKQPAPKQPDPESDPPRTMRFAPTPTPAPAPPSSRGPGIAPGAEAGYEHAYNPQQTSVSPLARYQRMPGISVRLPTDGKFLPAGAIEFDMSGEVQVYPMRAADELLLKSPDALMSGYAIECLLQSCVPAIKHPRMTSNPDLDVLLLAIKAVSNGNTMDIEYECPQCKKGSSLNIDLRQYLATAINDLPDTSVSLPDGMIIHLRPYNLHNATQISLGTYREARAIQAVEKDETAAEKQMVCSFKALTDLDIMMTSDCVLQIVVPEGVVNDRAEIMEFIPTLPERDLKQISTRLTELNSAGISKDTEVKCSHCGHEWTTQAEFDPASFFGASS